MKTLNLADRLAAARKGQKAQLECARAIAESPEITERRKAREAVVAARNARIAERKAAEQARKEQEAAQRAAAQRPRPLLARYRFRRSERPKRQERLRKPRERRPRGQRGTPD